MINEKLRQYIKEYNEDAVVFDNPSFDGSIIGISTEGHVIYDLCSMIQELSIDDQMSYEEASEFIDYNTLRALPYITEGTKPIILEQIVEC